MKKILYYAALLFAGTFLTTSCVGDLNQYPHIENPGLWSTLKPHRQMSIHRPPTTKPSWVNFMFPLLFPDRRRVAATPT